MNELIPILTVASADHATRSKWLERLFEAVQSDGVEYLAPLEDRWGEIAQYPDLINEGLGLMLSRSVSTADAAHRCPDQRTGRRVIRLAAGICVAVSVGLVRPTSFPRGWACGRRGPKPRLGAVRPAFSSGDRDRLAAARAEAGVAEAGEAGEHHRPGRGFGDSRRDVLPNGHVRPKGAGQRVVSEIGR